MKAGRTMSIQAEKRHGFDGHDLKASNWSSPSYRRTIAKSVKRSHLLHSKPSKSLACVESILIKVITNLHKDLDLVVTVY